MANFLRPKSWDERYSQRRLNIYSAEGSRLPFDSADSTSLVNAFLNHKHRSDRLDPPSSLTYVALLDYLRRGHLGRLLSRVPGENSHDVVLLDDRRHASERAPALRLGKDEDKKGYIGYSAAMAAREYLERTMQEKRHEQSYNAEKRNLFIAMPSSGTFLALAASCPQRTVHILRDFLQNYLLFQPSFKVACTNVSFVLEFHLPYYALREGVTTSDSRILHGKRLRTSTSLPLGRKKLTEALTYHKAKISCLITGVDDFLWTSYCFVDTYFGSEHMKSVYLKSLNGKGLDPATGGAMNLDHPFWNPRDYWLTILSQRIDQATMEWRNLLLTFDQRLEHYEVSCFDNAELDSTQDLRAAVDTIHVFKSTLASLVSSWKTFKERHLHWFETKDNETLSSEFSRSLGEIEDSMAQLLFWTEVLGDRYIQYSGMLSRVMSASGLKHNTIATQLAYYMKLVAGITLFFSPVNLVASLFSMGMVSEKLTSIVPAAVLILTAFLAHRLARRPDILRKFFPMGEG